MKPSRNRGPRLLLAVLLIAGIAGGLAWWLRPGSPLPERVKADSIVVDKSDRALTLMQRGKALKSYRVSLGRNPVGPKAQQGDSRTPEGQYRIDWRNAESRFYRALHVSYPNATDLKRAKELGVSPGGDIMIHGMKNGFGWVGRLHLLIDWTDGCIAVTDREMDELWRAVPAGTPIEIRA